MLKEVTNVHMLNFIIDLVKSSETFPTVIMICVIYDVYDCTYTTNII